MTVNAGEIPADHWTQDLDVGGGRILGEGCHFIDLVRHLCGFGDHGVSTTSIVADTGGTTTSDKASITLNFADGSFGVIHYLANGHKGFPKERLEVFCGDKILQLDNFRRLNGWGWKGFSRVCASGGRTRVRRHALQRLLMRFAKARHARFRSRKFWR